VLYGEGPWRVVGTSGVIIAVWTVLYLFTGGIEETVNSPNSITRDILLSFGPLVNSPPEWAITIFANLYFSVVTFTTLGYGDVKPASGAVQFLAGVESLLGSALIALLVVVLSRRVMR
jgi:voltage-gated potassium channel Kch